MDSVMRDLLERLLRHEDLTAGETEQAMNDIMTGRATSAQIAGLLVALAMKGERVDEMVGFARAMRAHATPWSGALDGCIDTCGTGGDHARTFNISSVAAIVVAACGVPVAKHGNRSVSSRCGSADLFEALGVNVTAGVPVVERCAAEAGIAFLFAPTFHPSMRHAGPTRRELGVRTAFNLLGPLTNPAGAMRQVVGVARRELADLVARALAALGSERAWVVHGADGLDEISLSGETQVVEVRRGEVSAFTVRPEDFGLPRGAVDPLRVDGPAESAAMARDVLDGREGTATDFVLANAAAPLVVADHVGTLADGVAAARDALRTGRARAVLATMARVTQAPGDRA